MLAVPIPSSFSSRQSRYLWSHLPKRLETDGGLGSTAVGTPPPTAVRVYILVPGRVYQGIQLGRPCTSARVSTILILGRPMIRISVRGLWGRHAKLVRRAGKFYDTYWYDSYDDEPTTVKYSIDIGRVVKH